MHATKTKFSVGDWIVHAFYGIGKIIDKGKMKLSGKAQTFFTVKLKNGKYWLSKEKSEVDYIRPLATKAQIKDALKEIKKQPESLPKRYTSRKKLILETVEEGSLLKHAALIRDLNGKKVKKKLSYEDKNWLSKLKKQFIYEGSLVYGEKKNAIKKKLKRALKASGKQYKEKK